MSDSQIMWAWLSRRRLNTIGFLICAAGLGYAVYAQQYLNLEPCPLCIFQRLAILAVGLVFLAALIHNPAGWGAKVYSALTAIVAGIGMGIAARHVWLQHLPPEETPRCGPGLDYMLKIFPLGETLREVLTGAGECAKVDWTLLGFSMPEWNLLLFFSLGVAGLMGNRWLRR
ncbi:MAG: disulfide bond formation protein B [Candidatus Competibacteraceae bacterium]